jgi:hypothetical protein
MILQSKNLKIFTAVALFIAGLFYFYESEKESALKILKPSQLDFSKSNELSKNYRPPADTQPTVKEIEENTLAKLQLDTAEAKAWKSLEEILKSKNDNDPRIDSELKNLSLNFHKAIYEKYTQLKPEQRNERGTLVFLIARDLKDANDLDFLKNVYRETPCLNMLDCSNSTDQVQDEAGSNQTTLQYPQLAGLYQLERQLQKRPEFLKDPMLRAGVVDVLQNAESYAVPQISEKAMRIREKYAL